MTRIILGACIVTRTQRACLFRFPEVQQLIILMCISEEPL